MTYFLSLLPILILLVWALARNVKEAVMTGLLVSIILFFYWGAGLPHFGGALVVALVTTVNILMIVFGAAFLYNIMDKTAMISAISHSLDELHPSREVRFFLLAICLTAFFEGVAGFGTPGAIVPLLLMAMGFNAILSVSVVLLFDGLFALFGAVGTPLITGMQLPLGLSNDQVAQIGLLSAVTVVLAGILIMFFIFRLFSRYHAPLQHKKEVWILYTFFSMPYCILAYLVPELATVLSAGIMLLAAVFYLKERNTKLNLRPWIPYATLALLLLLPKLWNPLNRWIGWDLAFSDLFGSGIGAGLKPLQSPLIPFLLVGIAIAFLKKKGSLYLADPFRKVLNVFVVLFPSIAIAQLMINSGISQPSMVSYTAEMMSRMGNQYVLFAPYIGVVGSFITGSTTISNIVFGASQLETAGALGFPSTSILALQHSGAALGNAICLFNIIAAAAIADLKNYRPILVNNLLPTLLSALIAGLLGYLFIWLTS